MFLLNKTNPDWWSVRKLNGQDGFVPANYVCEVEPKIMQVSVRRPHIVKSTRKVPKVKMVKQKVRVKKTAEKDGKHINTVLIQFIFILTKYFLFRTYKKRKYQS